VLEMHSVFCDVVMCVFFRLCWGFTGLSTREEGRVYVSKSVSCVLIGGSSLISETHNLS
jgi:hypothetical protein